MANEDSVPSQKDVMRLETKVDRVIELLQGKEGITIRLDRLEQWKTNIDDERKNVKGDLKSIFLPIVTDVIKVVAAALIVLVVYRTTMP